MFFVEVVEGSIHSFILLKHNLTRHGDTTRMLKMHDTNQSKHQPDGGGLGGGGLGAHGGGGSPGGGDAGSVSVNRSAGWFVPLSGPDAASNVHA